MEKTHKAITLDVKTGLYKPDERAKRTLHRFGQANKDARAALEADE
jgi:hypothetical protein